MPPVVQVPVLALGPPVEGAVHHAHGQAARQVQADGRATVQGEALLRLQRVPVHQGFPDRGGPRAPHAAAPRSQPHAPAHPAEAPREGRPRHWHRAAAHRFRVPVSCARLREAVQQGDRAEIPLRWRAQAVSRLPMRLPQLLQEFRVACTAQPAQGKSPSTRT